MNKKEFFWYYYTRVFIKPQSTLEQYLQNENYYKKGFLYILIPIICYTFMYIFLTIGEGAPSVFTPWLNIPKDIYYSVNRYLLAPSMVMCWLLAASAMHIMGKLFDGKGTFDQTLGVMALCIAAAMTAALLHDLPMSFLSAIKVINAKEHEVAMNSPTIWRTLLWISYSMYFVLFIVLFQKCALVVHKISKSKSYFVGTLSFIIFQVIFLIFNR